MIVHDAARPLLTRRARAQGRARRCCSDEQAADAAIAAAPVSDTIKRVDERRARSARRSQRSSLWAVQTPQVFRRAALERALDVSPRLLAAATDDAWLVERSGGRVLVVAGERREPQGDHAARPGDGRARCWPRASCARASARESCLNRRPQVLTDYHLHLRPDDLDASADEYFTRGQRRALPRRGERARHRRAGRLRAHLPLRAGARGLAAPLLGAVRARRPRRLLRVRARADRPAAGHRGGLRARRRGSHGQPAGRRATSTTWSARCTSSARAPSTWTTTACGTPGAAPRQIWRRYFQTIGEAARSGLFDVLAHPDLVKVWGGERPLPEGDLRRYYELAIDGIAESGIAVEVSTAGLRKRVAGALSGAGVPGDVPGGRRAGRALQRRPPPRGRRRGLRARAGAARRSSASASCACSSAASVAWSRSERPRSRVSALVGHRL